MSAAVRVSVYPALLPGVVARQPGHPLSRDLARRVRPVLDEPCGVNLKFAIARPLHGYGALLRDFELCADVARTVDPLPASPAECRELDRPVAIGDVRREVRHRIHVTEAGESHSLGWSAQNPRARCRRARGGIQGTGSDLRIGVTTGPGTAMGTVTVTGGISNFSDVRVGNVQLSLAAADSGPATGSLSLIDGGLSATNLVIGVTEAPNTATATGTFDLNKNLAEVADTLTLGNGATISLDFEGFLRGVEYGAINANQAILDGTLELNFLFQPAFGVFDLIVSGSDTGITGDFDSVQFFGLADGTLTNFGIVLDQGVETWRLQIGPAQIPEPGTLIAVTTALVLLGLTRRRRASL